MSLRAYAGSLPRGESGRIGENQDVILPSLTPFDSRLQPENRRIFPCLHTRGGNALP